MEDGDEKEEWVGGSADGRTGTGSGRLSRLGTVGYYGLCGCGLRGRNDAAAAKSLV